MRIIVGLGNPGDEYEGTRHNAGSQFVDKLAEVLSTKYEVRSEYGWWKHHGVMVYKTEKLVLIKSKDVFMNESGRIIHELDAKRYSLDALYVAHDDLDIRLGDYKIQKGRGPKVHGGVNSLEAAMGKDFWRIRIGIENRQVPIDGEAYVLQKFTVEERKILDEVMQKIVDEITKTTN